MIADVITELILGLLAIAYFILHRKASRKVADLETELDRTKSELGCLKAEMESGDWKEFTASYMVTDSDEIRSKSSKDIYYNARKRIANNIGWDIVKNYQPEETMSESGHTVYTYRFKVRR